MRNLNLVRAFEIKELENDSMLIDLENDYIGRLDTETMIQSKTSASLDELFDLYFSPVLIDGKVREGCGIAYKDGRNKYVFSTMNGKIPPGKQIDLVVSWKDGAFDDICMSVATLKEWKRFVKREDKRMKQLGDGFVETNPLIIVEKLKRYTSIKGEGTESDYGIVTGTLNGTKFPILKAFHKFLHERDSVDFDGDIIRSFEVVIPSDIQEDFEHQCFLEKTMLEIKEKEDTLYQIQSSYQQELDELRQEYDDAARLIQIKRENDDDVKKAVSLYNKALTALEKQKDEFNSIIEAE